MLPTDELAVLIRGVRRGDQQAATDFVRTFEPLIRREIRLRLEDHRVSSAYDSSDISQSVLSSFFVRATVGQYDLNEPLRLIGLLRTMTRRKIAALVRREHRLKRDWRRRQKNHHDAMSLIASREPSPSAIASADELLARAAALLDNEELEIARWRQSDCSWAEVAERMGGTAHARRVQFMRAMRRVERQLGVGDRS